MTGHPAAHRPTEFALVFLAECLLDGNTKTFVQRKIATNIAKRRYVRATVSR
ncbi:hypothetical protein CBM2586_B90225 [Cupriavidus phytorum]|uniref:Uncharacterized protein n=1 Tax=Cupriavidus taiwanensis TaxID=164546 RepID=A0A976AC56_9BURK|nr:hypothetical protein CBM2586_B90225 [Cupriavidus taiwanensis]